MIEAWYLGVFLALPLHQLFHVLVELRHPGAPSQRLPGQLLHKVQERRAVAGPPVNLRQVFANLQVLGFTDFRV
jgi:hypothetical protein